MSFGSWKRFLILLGVSMMLLQGCSRSPQAEAARYLEKGKEAIQAKNYAAATLHLKSAIQAQSSNAEAYYQLGLAYAGLSEFNSAASCFLKASELNPKHTAAQLKLAELMAASGTKAMLEEAQKRSQDVLTALPGNIDALNILAMTELRLGNPESAEAHLQDAVRRSPSNLRSSVALAQAKLARKDPAGAEEVLKQAAARAPQSPEPRVSLGGFYLSTGKTAEAETEFRRALQINPKHGPALLALGAMLVRAGKFDQAERTYQQVSALPEREYKPIHALYLFQSGKREQALAEFETLAKSNPSDRTLRTQLVGAYLAANRIADAEKMLTAALKKNGRDTDALLQRSQVYLGSKKYAEAQADLNQVLHFHSDSAEAHYLLSKVRQGRGEAELQRQELGEALKLDASYLLARLDLAQGLTTSGGAQQALEILNQAPEAQQGMAPWVIQRNWALLSLGRAEEARKGVSQLLATARTADALLQDAALKASKKDFAGARASAEEALKQNPEDTRALTLLAQTYSAQNQPAAGVQKVREYAAKLPQSAPVQRLLGQYLAAGGDRAGARTAYEAAKAANPALVNADLALASLDLAEGKRDAARKRLSDLVSAHPDNVPARNFQAQLELTEGKNAAAIAQYRKVLELDDKNAGALNNLAYLLAESNQPDEALKYAQMAKQVAPENATVDDTLGWTYYQKGLYSSAVPYLRNAVAKEATARRQYHLAMALLKAGDAKGGRETLETALKMDARLPEAQTAQKLFETAK